MATATVRGSNTGNRGQGCSGHAGAPRQGSTPEHAPRHAACHCAQGLQGCRIAAPALVPLVHVEVGRLPVARPLRLGTAQGRQRRFRRVLLAACAHMAQFHRTPHVWAVRVRPSTRHSWRHPVNSQARCVGCFTLAAHAAEYTTHSLSQPPHPYSIIGRHASNCVALLYPGSAVTSSVA